MPDRNAPRPGKPNIGKTGFSQATIANFAEYLHSLGFAPSTVQQYVGIARRFRSWLCQPRRRRQSACDASVATFIRQHGTTKDGHHIRSSLKHLLRMLRERGELAPVPPPEPTAIDLAVQRFVSHLSDAAGLAESTCQRRAFYTRQFLMMTFGNGPLRLDRLCRKDLVRFVRRYAKGWTPNSIHTLASSLRRYLRYLQLQGICGEQLIAAVPTSPRWKQASIPRVMTEEQLCTFLSCFDRSTAIGKRNYAIAQVFDRDMARSRNNPHDAHVH